MLEIIVSKGNHQRVTSAGEDDGDVAGNVDGIMSKYGNPFFIDTFNHILKCQWDRDAIIDTFLQSYERL